MKDVDEFFVTFLTKTKIKSFTFLVGKGRIKFCLIFRLHIVKETEKYRQEVFMAGKDVTIGRNNPTRISEVRK